MKSEKSLHCGLNKYRAQYAKMAIAGDVLFDFLLHHSFEINAVTSSHSSSIEQMLESVSNSNSIDELLSLAEKISNDCGLNEFVPEELLSHAKNTGFFGKCSVTFCEKAKIQIPTVSTSTTHEMLPTPVMKTKHSASMMLIGRFVMSAYKYAVLFLASGRCNFFNLNTVMCKCISPKFFESGQPHYQRLMLISMLESYCFPDNKVEALKRGFVTKIKNDLSYMFCDEAQEWANRIFVATCRSNDGSHMKSKALSLDEMHKIQFIVEHQWKDRTESQTEIQETFRDPQTRYRHRKRSEAVQYLIRHMKDNPEQFAHLRDKTISLPNENFDAPPPPPSIDDHPTLIANPSQSILAEDKSPSIDIQNDPAADQDGQSSRSLEENIEGSNLSSVLTIDEPSLFDGIDPQKVLIIMKKYSYFGIAQKIKHWSTDYTHNKSTFMSDKQRIDAIQKFKALSATTTPSIAQVLQEARDVSQPTKVISSAIHEEEATNTTLLDDNDRSTEAGSNQQMTQHVVLYGMKKSLFSIDTTIIEDSINPSKKVQNILLLRGTSVFLENKVYHGTSTKFQGLWVEAKKNAERTKYEGVNSGFETLIGQFVNMTNALGHIESLTNLKFLIQQPPAIVKATDKGLLLSFRKSNEFQKAISKLVAGLCENSAPQLQFDCFYFSEFPKETLHFVIDVPSLRAAVPSVTSDKSVDDYCYRFWTAALATILMGIDGKDIELHLSLDATFKIPICERFYPIYKNNVEYHSIPFSTLAYQSKLPTQAEFETQAATTELLCARLAMWLVSTVHTPSSSTRRRKEIAILNNLKKIIVYNVREEVVHPQDWSEKNPRYMEVSYKHTGDLLNVYEMECEIILQDNTIIYNSCDKAVHISHMLDKEEIKNIIFSADSTIMETLFLTTYVKDEGSDSGTVSGVGRGLEENPPQPQNLLRRFCILQQALHPTGGEEMYCDIQKVRTY